MIDSCSQTGHRRKMILSQSFAQSASSLSGGAETGTKRIVTSKGFRLCRGPAKISARAEPLLLKKIQLNENI
jgi:hypothetical protein